MGERQGGKGESGASTPDAVVKWAAGRHADGVRFPDRGRRKGARVKTTAFDYSAWWAVNAYPDSDPALIVAILVELHARFRKVLARYGLEALLLDLPHPDHLGTVVARKL